MTKNQPFFTHHRDSDTFMPTPVSSGPWDLNSLHGRRRKKSPSFRGIA